MRHLPCRDRFVAHFLLGLSAWLGVSWPAPAGEEPAAAGQAGHRFPDCAFVVDVTRPPYNAKGDGATDDTAALQRALDDVMGLHKVVYLPNGTYLISDTLTWKNKGSQGNAAYGFNWVQGQDAAKTVLRLRDGAFADPQKAKAMMWCGGFGSADWFHNFVQDLTFDVGRGNAGAVGLQFYTNNTGAVRDCVIRSRDGKGDVGLDLGHRGMNGPLLVQRVSVQGFRRGVVTSGAVNSQTFERLTLKGQTEFGFDNHGQAISIRGLVSDNAVPAVRSYGTLSLVEAKLTGRGAAGGLPAVVNYNGGRLCLRDVVTAGYRRALADVATPDYFAALRVTGRDKAGSAGPRIAEYFSHPATSPFGAAARSLRLPVEEPPEVPRDPPKDWAVVDAFGGDPTGRKDSSAAIQAAIDSGAATVFFPGFYAMEKPVTVRGKVRRLLGTGAWIDYASKSKPDFVIGDGEAEAVVVEGFAPIGGGIEIRTDRNVILRSVQAGFANHGAGSLFLEDVSTGGIRVSKGQRVWARQLNVENEGTHIANDGGRLWVLGYKTERGGTLLHTSGGGRSEVFGTFSYTTTAGKLAPMFVTHDAAAFAFFSEVCYNGDPFAMLVRETRQGVTKEIKRGEGAVAPYVGLPAGR